MSARPHRRGVMAGALAVGLARCGISASKPDVRIALIGSLNAEVNGSWVWLQAFRDSLVSDGFTTDVSPNAALGGEFDRTELTALGLVQANDAGVTELSAYSDAYKSAVLSFLFDDLDHFDRFVADTEFREWLQQDLDRAGLHFVDAAFLGGMTGLFTAKRPVRTVADLKGMRLRAMGRTDLLIIEALGASGVQVAWEEVPQALQTGIAEGYLNPPLAPVLFGHGSQINYFAALAMSASHRAIVFSRRWLEGLSADERAAVDRAAAAGRAANRRWAAEGAVREREALAAIGVEITHPTAEDRREFVERVSAAYSKMAPEAAWRRAAAIAERVR